MKTPSVFQQKHNQNQVNLCVISFANTFVLPKEAYEKSNTNY